MTRIALVCLSVIVSVSSASSALAQFRGAVRVQPVYSSNVNVVRPAARYVRAEDYGACVRECTRRLINDPNFTARDHFACVTACYPFSVPQVRPRMRAPDDEEWDYAACVQFCDDHYEDEPEEHFYCIHECYINYGPIEHQAFRARMPQYTQPQYCNVVPVCQPVTLRSYQPVYYYCPPARRGWRPVFGR